MIPTKEETISCLNYYSENNNFKGLCGNMKDVDQAFRDKLQKIVELLDKGNLSGCYIVSRNITGFSTTLDYDDGILISELLEGVFSQIGPLFETYDINDGDKKQLSSDIKNRVAAIIEHYRDEDKNQLYLALQQTRAIATKFQLNRWESGKRKRRVRESEE